MKSFKDWSLRSKLLIPLFSTGLVTGFVIWTASTLVFEELKDHTISQLQVINGLRSVVFDLVGEYREYLNSPEPSSVLEGITGLKDHIEETSIQLEGLLLTDGHTIVHPQEHELGHQPPSLELFRTGLKKLTALGDKLLGVQDAIAEKMAQLEVSEGNLLEVANEAQGVVAREVEDAARQDDWKAVAEAHLSELSALAKVDASAQAYLSEMREYMLNPSEDALQDLGEIGGDLERHLATFARTAEAYPEEEPFIRRLEVELNTLIGHSKSLVQVRDELTESLKELEEVSESFQKILRTMAESIAKETDISVGRGSFAIGASVSGAIVLTLLLLWWIAQGIVGSVSRLRQAALQLGGGDLTTRAEVDRGDEVGQLAAAFNEMAGDLSASTAALERAQAELVRKERLAAVGQLTATVSHELRNPLGAIRSGIDAIKKLAPDEPHQMTRAIALIDRSEGRCNRIISDLLSFTRVQNLDRRETDLDDWLGDVLDEINVPPGTTLRRDFTAGVRIGFDRDRMQRAMQNVIGNAFQAMESSNGNENAVEKPEIVVTTRTLDDRLEVSVSDNGPGIPPEDMAKVFEPLYTTKSFGIGLGLPMVRQTMQQHGGDADIMSEVGRGTSLVLWIPLRTREQGKTS